MWRTEEWWGRKWSVAVGGGVKTEKAKSKRSKQPETAEMREKRRWRLRHRMTLSPMNKSLEDWRRMLLLLRSLIFFFISTEKISCFRFFSISIWLSKLFHVTFLSTNLPLYKNFFTGYHRNTKYSISTESPSIMYFYSI